MSDHTIRTLSDGSIDYAYYTQRGRKLRSEAAHELIEGIGTAMSSPPAVRSVPPSGMPVWFFGIRGFWNRA